MTGIVTTVTAGDEADALPALTSEDTVGMDMAGEDIAGDDGERETGQTVV